MLCPFCTSKNFCFVFIIISFFLFPSSSSTIYTSAGISMLKFPQSFFLFCLLSPVRHMTLSFLFFIIMTMFTFTSSLSSLSVLDQAVPFLFHNLFQFFTPTSLQSLSPIVPINVVYFIFSLKLIEILTRPSVARVFTLFAPFTERRINLAGKSNITLLILRRNCKSAYIIIWVPNYFI